MRDNTEPGNEKERCVTGKAEQEHPDNAFREIDEHFRRLVPWLIEEQSDCSAECEGRPDHVSKGDQASGQSPDETWVRPCEQERNGQEVTISGYWRRIGHRNMRGNIVLLPTPIRRPLMQPSQSGLNSVGMLKTILKERNWRLAKLEVTNPRLTRYPQKTTGDRR